MDVGEQLFHAAGAAHGSVYFKALDDAAWFAAHSVYLDSWIVTSSFQLHLLRPVSDGVITAYGRLVHRSRRMFVAESELHDAGGRLLARGSGSFMPTGEPLTEEIGYS